MNKSRVTLLLDANTSEPESLRDGQEFVRLFSADEKVNGTTCRVWAGQSSRTDFRIVRRTTVARRRAEGKPKPRP